MKNLSYYEFERRRKLRESRIRRSKVKLMLLKQECENCQGKIYRMEESLYKFCEEYWDKNPIDLEFLDGKKE